jgi:hypothetical protein
LSPGDWCIAGKLLNRITGAGLSHIDGEKTDERRWVH